MAHVLQSSVCDLDTADSGGQVISRGAAILGAVGCRAAPLAVGNVPRRWQLPQEGDPTPRSAGSVLPAVGSAPSKSRVREGLSARPPKAHGDQLDHLQGLAHAEVQLDAWGDGRPPPTIAAGPPTPPGLEHAPLVAAALFLTRVFEADVKLFLPKARGGRSGRGDERGRRSAQPEPRAPAASVLWGADSDLCSKTERRLLCPRSPGCSLGSRPKTPLRSTRWRFRKLRSNAELGQIHRDTSQELVLPSKKLNNFIWSHRTVTRA